MRTAAAFLLALLLLGWGVGASSVTAALTDPVGGIRAQDEALYAHAALVLAERGGWLTPRFLGRYLLYKPPLAAWLGGASVKLFGVSLVTLRLPFVLAACLGCLIVFVWLRRAHGEAAAWAGLLLLAGSSLWQILARLAYTDMLVALSMTGALFCATRDPQYERRSTPLVIGLFIALGILAKSIAGLLPLVALALLGPPIRRFMLLCVWVIVFSAPWHIYQLLVHQEWFWTEYVERQILAFGTRSIAIQGGEEPHAIFYGRRLLWTDPLLVALGVAGLIAAVRRRDAAPLVWAATVVAGLLAFRYRNLQYAIALLPALALAAARWRPRVVLVLALVAIPVKALFPLQPWGLRFGHFPDPPATRNLRNYASLARGNPLVLVATDDEFYSSVLPLARVHYYFVDPRNIAIDYAPQYVPLGITMRGEEFRDLGRHIERYHERLRAWGLDSTEPIATTVVDADEASVLATVRQRPDCDYYLPAPYRAQPPPPTHDRRDAEGGRVFWLARLAQPRTHTLVSVPAGIRW